jgi:colicin import membrane protein
MTRRLVLRITIAAFAALVSCAEAPSTQEALRPQSSAPAPWPPGPQVFTDSTEYAQAVQGRIRRNLVLPDGIPLSAGAVAELTLTPSGEVEELKIVQSSGYRLYDDAIESAVFHAEPLPVMQA